MMITRESALHFYIRTFQAQGYYISEKNMNWVKMVRPSPIHHWWHILLSVITAGMWLPFYGLIAIVKRPRIVFLTIYPDHIHIDHA